MTAALPALLYAPLALTAVVALCLLLWVLAKGDVCPGQRRRISDGLLSGWAVFGLAVMLGADSASGSWLVFLGGVSFVIGIAVLLYQGRLAGKRSLPLSWHGPGLLLAILYGAVVVFHYGPTLLLAGGAGGCVFAHLIMVRAKHRLTAFNTLLPLVGIAFAIAWLLLLVIQTYVADLQGEMTAGLIRPFVQMSAAMLLGAILWLFPLLRQQDTSPPLIAVVALLIIGGLAVGQSILWQLASNIS